MTRLRRRYIEELRLKNFSPGTIKVYVHAVEKFARHFGRSPHELSQEDIRAYLVHRIEQGLARASCVVVRNALRGKFIDFLKQAFSSGRLAFHGKLASLAQPAAFEHCLNVSARNDWGVYAKPPFGGSS